MNVQPLDGSVHQWCRCGHILITYYQRKSVDGLCYYQVIFKLPVCPLYLI